jgi:predicted CXXCH cytochrome family protein
MDKLGKMLWILAGLCLLCGCDPVTVHKVTTTIFDGVPSLPEPQQYCQEYHENKLKSEREEAKSKEAVEPVATGSVHPPYRQKQCERCHDKSKDSGLIRPKNEICFVCHPKIIKKSFVHGPASVGGCLECHDPHSSNFPSLLKFERATICSVCHRERRMADAMHTKVIAKGMVCVDCHNPHAGDAQFFLK